MSTEFDAALQHIESDDPIQSSLLYGLSVMTKENLAKFQHAWPKIKPDRREEITTNLVENQKR